MPYSSLHSLTSPPFGFTAPFNVAEVCVTPRSRFSHRRRRVRQGRERPIAAFARPVAVGRHHPEVVGRVRGEAADRRRYRDRAAPRPRRRHARGARPIGARRAVFQLAFADFAPVRVHAPVQRRRSLRDTRRRFGHDRRRARRRFQRRVSPKARPARIRRRPPGSGRSCSRSNPRPPPTPPTTLLPDPGDGTHGALDP